MSKKALITGITGQDGAYLAKFLLEKGYTVYGTFRRVSTPNFWRLNYLKILEKVELIPMDLADLSSIIEAIIYSEPDEIYLLAAQSFVGRSFEEPISTSDITGLGAVRMLEAARLLKTDARIYQASTSELYGNDTSKLKNENSQFRPESPYAAAKLYSYWITKIYKHGYGMFVCNGILFNHESPIRGLEFVSRKVTNAVARIKLGLQKDIHLGNMKAIRDWGYAGDYVNAMWLMMQQDYADNFVIATGVGHSVEELVKTAFSEAGLDSSGYVVKDRTLERPVDVNSLIGDYTKAKTELGWIPKTSFQELVSYMYQEDFRRWNDFINGKQVIWDAPSYNDKLKIASVRYSLRL
jgi:GDPmannose 4,6-dehydratase